MAKVMITATLIYQYEADTDDYPTGLDAQGIADFDTNEETASMVADLGRLEVHPS